MKRLGLYLFLIAAVAVLAGCGKKARIIPPSRMSKIYADMLLSDQWLRDNPEARKVADTSFFYAPVFSKYGYDKADYDATVKEYIKQPEKFSKILKKTMNILEQRRRELIEIQQSAAENPHEVKQDSLALDVKIKNK